MKTVKEVDNIRMAIDDASTAIEQCMNRTAGPMMLAGLRLAQQRLQFAAQELNVLAERQGPGGESASDVIHRDSPSPLVTCDGVKECALAHPEQCPHSKPHKVNSMCQGETPRCSDCPPPLGVCR